MRDVDAEKSLGIHDSFFFKQAMMMMMMMMMMMEYLS